MSIEGSTCFLVIVFVAVTLASPYVRRRDVFDNAVDSPDGLLGHLRHQEETLYSLPSNESGRMVAEWNEDMGVNPEELGSYVEGDILFPEAMGRNGLKSESSRWPKGVVPYVISPIFRSVKIDHFQSTQVPRSILNKFLEGTHLKRIQEAMNDYHKNTCIKFKPYNGEGNDYIRITSANTGCWSSVGRTGGPQDVNLQIPGCVSQKGTIIHELMHAIGFLHEQSRWERDNYVSINWDNIQAGRTGNFEKATQETTDAFGVGYDYGSVMHYSPKAFSKNGKPTIEPKESNGLLSAVGEFFLGKQKVAFGQRAGFSKLDIQKIRRMYKCTKRRRSFYY